MRREVQDEKIASLLGGLESVDAPHGFESRVMRRIAERRSGGETHRSVLLLVLKFAAPAAMLVLMGMLFVFFGDSEVSHALVPPVQEMNSPIAPPATEAPPALEGALASASPTEIQPAVQPPANTARPKPAPSPRIMSEDFAVQGPGETLRPERLDPDPAAGVPPSRRFLPIQLLDVFGIESVCTSVNCTVRKVRPNSPAARSGVLEGDAVISIDEKPVGTTHLYPEEPQIRSIKVRRDGQIIRLQLRN